MPSWVGNTRTKLGSHASGYRTKLGYTLQDTALTRFAYHRARPVYARRSARRESPRWPKPTQSYPPTHTKGNRIIAVFLPKGRSDFRPTRYTASMITVAINLLQDAFPNGVARTKLGSCTTVHRTEMGSRTTAHRTKMGSRTTAHRTKGYRTIAVYLP